MVQGKMPKAEFWILGDGPEKAALEVLVYKLGLHQKVKFIGMIPQEDIPFWLYHCDVGVLPTRRDIFLELSFSNKLSEYILMEKPVIVSRLKTIQHYFSEKALFFFEPENPLDLSRKMTFFYSHCGIKLNKVEQAKKEYSKINWTVMKQRYLALIKSA